MQCIARDMSKHLPINKYRDGEGEKRETNRKECPIHRRYGRDAVRRRGPDEHTSIKTCRGDEWENESQNGSQIRKYFRFIGIIGRNVMLHEELREHAAAGAERAREGAVIHAGYAA